MLFERSEIVSFMRSYRIKVRRYTQPIDTIMSVQDLCEAGQDRLLFDDVVNGVAAGWQAAADGDAEAAGGKV